MVLFLGGAKLRYEWSGDFSGGAQHPPFTPNVATLTVKALSSTPYGFALEMTAKFMKRKKTRCVLCVLYAPLGMSICGSSADSKLNMAFINK